MTGIYNMRTERIGIRITKELKEKLEFLAMYDSRSFSNYIEKLLNDHVDKYYSDKSKEYVKCVIRD